MVKSQESTLPSHIVENLVPTTVPGMINVPPCPSSILPKPGHRATRGADFA